MPLVLCLKLIHVLVNMPTKFIKNSDLAHFLKITDSFFSWTAFNYSKLCQLEHVCSPAKDFLQLHQHPPIIQIQVVLLSYFFSMRFSPSHNLDAILLSYGHRKNILFLLEYLLFISTLKVSI